MRKSNFKTCKGIPGKYFWRNNLTNLAKNYGFCAFQVCAEATPVSSILVESKKKNFNQKAFIYPLGITI